MNAREQAKLRILMAWICVAWFAASASAGMFDAPEAVKVSAVWSSSSASPGDQRVLAVVLQIEDTYHVNPDAAQLTVTDVWDPVPTSVSVGSLSPHVTVGAAQYPEPHTMSVSYLPGQAVNVWEGRVVLYVPVSVAATASVGDYDLTATVTYQACDATSCYPPTTTTTPITLHVGAPGAADDAPPPAGLFDGYDPNATAAATPVANSGGVTFDLFNWSFTIDPQRGLGLFLLLLTAAVGGFFLNFTPCVLPMIPIKIMGLSRAAGNRSRCLWHGVLMSAGVVGFWLAIGVALATITGFRSINELFQFPAFTIGVGLVIIAMAVGMCGLFALHLPRFIYNVSPRQDTASGAVGFGVMTAVLSTPCTAPFMGAAAAWAVTQHAPVVLATFAAIGIGMALPYLLLAAFPKLIDRVPRTGPASELVKQVMGLLMLAAGAYFVGAGLSTLLNAAPDPPSTVHWWAVAALIAAAGIWLTRQSLKLCERPAPRAIWSGVGLLMLALSVWLGPAMTREGPIHWTYFTPQRLNEARARNDVIVMDFTAEWCLNCKALEHSQLNQGAVASLLNTPGVTPVKVDITNNRSTEVNALFAAVDRVTIPLLVVFDRRGNAVFKSDTYTAQQVVDAVASALSTDG